MGYKMVRFENKGKNRLLRLTANELKDWEALDSVG
jgi:hypothetical protein